MTDPKFAHMLRILKTQAGLRPEDDLSQPEKVVLATCRDIEERVASETFLPIGLTDEKARDFLHHLCLVYQPQLGGNGHMGRYVAIMSFLATFLRAYPVLEPDVVREFATISIPI